MRRSKPTIILERTDYINNIVPVSTTIAYLKK